MCAPRARTFPPVTSRSNQAGVLRPQDVALVAAFGLTHVEVRRRIRVAVFSTGNELVSPGLPRGAAQLFDSTPLHADGHAGAARLRGQRSRYPRGRSRGRSRVP